MKKYLFLLAITMLIYSCNSDNIDDNTILPNIPVNETIFLNNPEFINLQVPGGWAYAQGGISGIIVYHYSSDNYVAFERSAPHLTPESCSRMDVKNDIIMFCSCDASEFGILNGAPLSEGVSYPARQYRAELVGNNTLQITNY